MGILVLGDIIIDEYWIGTASRLSPEAPVPVINDLRKEKRIGGAGNVALNIRAMGSDCHLISQASLRDDMSALEDLKLCLMASDSTPHKIRIMAGEHVICRIDNEQYQKVIPKQSWIDTDASICVLSDYNKGFLHGSSDLIEWCNQRSIRTIVDPKKSWDHYRGCWLLKANEKELEVQIGSPFTPLELGDICKGLSERYDIRNLVVTLGPMGLYSWADGDGRMIEARASNVTDVTGAGDVVLAALAHYIDQGLDLHSAAVIANRLAGISIGQRGTHVITKEDLASAEEKLVFTNGCFDVLHKGHLDYLRTSRQLGTKLIVGLNSDRSVRELKGSDRPVNSETDRKAMLESLEFVDEVIIFDEPTPRELILTVKPNIITKGGDYTVDQVVGNDLVNQVIIIPLVGDYSTTNLLKRIKR